MPLLSETLLPVLALTQGMIESGGAMTYSMDLRFAIRSAPAWRATLIEPVPTSRNE